MAERLPAVMQRGVGRPRHVVSTADNRRSCIGAALTRVIEVDCAIVDQFAVDPAVVRGTEAVRAGDKLTTRLPLIAARAEALKAEWLWQGCNRLSPDHAAVPGAAPPRRVLSASRREVIRARARLSNRAPSMASSNRSRRQTTPASAPRPGQGASARHPGCRPPASQYDGSGGAAPGHAGLVRAAAGEAGPAIVRIRLQIRTAAAAGLAHRAADPRTGGTVRLAAAFAIAHLLAARARPAAVAVDRAPPTQLRAVLDRTRPPSPRHRLLLPPRGGLAGDRAQWPERRAKQHDGDRAAPQGGKHVPEPERAASGIHRYRALGAMDARVTTVPRTNPAAAMPGAGHGAVAVVPRPRTPKTFWTHRRWWRIAQPPIAREAIHALVGRLRCDPLPSRRPRGAAVVRAGPPVASASQARRWASAACRSRSVMPGTMACSLFHPVAPVRLRRRGRGR